MHEVRNLAADKAWVAFIVWEFANYNKPVSLHLYSHDRPFPQYTAHQGARRPGFAQHSCGCARGHYQGGFFEIAGAVSGFPTLYTKAGKGVGKFLC